MAIDIRADITCSLGTVISGSIGDDYIQGNGLVKTKGEVEISGLITPAIGTPVTFSYTKDQVVRSIPRKLRVLSSFADPFRRTTKVELGCKLTYLEDLKEAIDWTSLNDPQNSNYSQEDKRVITIPIHAASVMDQCLQNLGITASSNPLTSKFSIETFNFGDGYVNILGDLLVSESFFGYLDENEVLQIVNLSQADNLGPLYDRTDIIDLGQVNSGNLPGESVVVSYDTLKLRPPDGSSSEDEISRRLWEFSATETGPNYYYYGDRVWTGVEVTETRTTYGEVNGKDVPIKRVTSEYGLTAKVGGSIASQYLQNGISFNAFYDLLREEEEIFSYDSQATLTGSILNTYENSIALFGSLSLKYVLDNGSYVTFYSKLINTARMVTEYSNQGNYQQQIASEYKLWPFTIPGQQAVAEFRETLASLVDIRGLIDSVAQSGVVHARTTSSVNTTGLASERPKNLTNGAFARGGNASNDWRTESQSEIRLSLGSATAQRRTEFSMPYAPDDTFTGQPGGPYLVVPGNAEAKATAYGRIQNRLLLGNRNGISLQLAADKIPSAPFSPVYVEANGLTASYRTNGSQWAFDGNGIICSTDALFWGAVGGTGEFWFPVAPGIVTLPQVPPPVNGYINPTSVIPPYNETLICRSVVKTQIEVQSFPYSFTLPVTALAVPVKTKAVFSRLLAAESGATMVQGSSANLILERKITALSGALIINLEEAKFVPRKIQADSASYYIAGQSASLLVANGVQAGVRLPRLGGSLPADITGDTTGWVEHFTNSQWFNTNSSSYVTPNPDCAYLPFSALRQYFIGIANTGIIPDKYFNDCFIANYPYMQFNGYPYGGWAEAIYVTPSEPPFPKLFFGAEIAPGGSLESFPKMVRRVLYKQDYMREYAYRAVTIRYEGTLENSATPLVPDIIAEITFPERGWTSSYQRDIYVIEVRLGRVANLNGALLVTDGDAVESSVPIAENSSWIFQRGYTETQWTILPEHYLV